MRVRLRGWLLTGVLAAMVVGLFAACAATAGCDSAAQTQLTASDALLQVAQVIDAGVVEYHGEVATQDKTRRDDVLDALVVRVTIEPDKRDEHAAAAKAALDRIAADGETEAARVANLSAATDVLREMAGRLRSLAIERLAMTERARTAVRPYLLADSQPPPAPAPPPAALP